MEPCRAVGGFRPAKGCLLGRVVLGWLGAVEDDLLDFTRNVSPPDQLVQVFPVGLARGAPRVLGDGLFIPCANQCDQGELEPCGGLGDMLTKGVAQLVIYSSPPPLATSQRNAVATGKRE